MITEIMYAHTKKYFDRMILGLGELNIYIGIFMKPVHEIMVPIEYVSSEGSDEPAHPQKIVSAFNKA